MSKIISSASLVLASFSDSEDDGQYLFSYDNEDFSIIDYPIVSSFYYSTATAMCNKYFAIADPRKYVSTDHYGTVTLYSTSNRQYFKRFTNPCATDSINNGFGEIIDICDEYTLICAKDTSNQNGAAYLGNNETGDLITLTLPDAAAIDASSCAINNTYAFIGRNPTSVFNSNTGEFIQYIDTPYLNDQGCFELDDNFLYIGDHKYSGNHQLEGQVLIYSLTDFSLVTTLENPVNNINIADWSFFGGSVSSNGQILAISIATPIPCVYLYTIPFFEFYTICPSLPDIGQYDDFAAGLATTPNKTLLVGVPKYTKEYTEEGALIVYGDSLQRVLEGYWLNITSMYSIGEYGVEEDDILVASKTSNDDGSTVSTPHLYLDTDWSISFERDPVLLRFIFDTEPTGVLSINIPYAGLLLDNIEITNPKYEWPTKEIGPNIGLIANSDFPFSLQKIEAYIPPTVFYEDKLELEGYEHNSFLGINIDSSTPRT